MFVIDLKQLVNRHFMVPAEPQGNLQSRFLLAPFIAGEGVLADEKSTRSLPLGEAPCLAGLL